MTMLAEGAGIGQAHVSRPSPHPRGGGPCPSEELGLLISAGQSTDPALWEHKGHPG